MLLFTRFELPLEIGLRAPGAGDATARRTRRRPARSGNGYVFTVVYTLGRHGWMLEGCARVDDAPVGADDAVAKADGRR